MSFVPFNSFLKTEFNNYLDLRTAQGHVGKERHILISLDSFLQKSKYMEKILTPFIIDNWFSSLPKNMHANTKIVYISHYSGFAKYLNSIGIAAFIPERPSGEQTYTPYIFTTEEINQIFKAADNLKFTKKLSMQFPLIVRLLYSSGMRVGEVLNLKISDADFNEGIILIRNGKGNKDRYVPLTADLNDMLRMYCNITKKKYFSEELLFQNTKNAKHFTAWVGKNFNKCLVEAEITKLTMARNARNICPHCLRHTFAVHSFRKQEQLGVDVYVAAPLISAYMGHSSFRDTEYYLRLTDEIGMEIISKTSNYANVFPEVPR